MADDTNQDPLKTDLHDQTGQREALAQDRQADRDRVDARESESVKSAIRDRMASKIAPPTGPAPLRSRLLNRVDLMQIAELCHEANRIYCAQLGEYSQLAWEFAPAWQRNSAMTSVRAALDGQSPEQLHQSWLEEKTRVGWVYGLVKDPNATPPTHPCFVRYDQLPVEQRRKDYLFAAIVNAMAVEIS